MLIYSAKIYNYFNVVTKFWCFFVKCGGDTKKAKPQPRLLLWGKVDSNHRTDTRTDLQSVAIATMRLPQEMNEPFVFF